MAALSYMSTGGLAIRVWPSVSAQGSTPVTGLQGQADYQQQYQQQQE